MIFRRQFVGINWFYVFEKRASQIGHVMSLRRNELLNIVLNISKSSSQNDNNNNNNDNY